MKNNRRNDDAYQIVAAAKCLKVLSALSIVNFMTLNEISLKLKNKEFNINYCFRALKTLKIAGLVIEDERGWRKTIRASEF